MNWNSDSETLYVKILGRESGKMASMKNMGFGLINLFFFLHFDCAQCDNVVILEFFFAIWNFLRDTNIAFVRVMELRCNLVF